MKARGLWMVGLFAVLSVLVGGSRVARAGAPYYFPQTGYSLSDTHSFLSYWLGHGGLMQFGYPISDEHLEHNQSEDIDYIVQWFERARFEYHTDAPAPYKVLLGLLGHTVADPHIAAGEAGFAPVAPFASTPTHWFMAQTGHSLSNGFLAYWQAHGGLAINGYPLSEEVTETTAEGTYTIQYFERARYEYHPEVPPQYRVLLGLLGKQVQPLIPVAPLDTHPTQLMVPAQFKTDVFNTAHTFMFPQGFTISVFAAGINDPRLMAVAPNGDLFVGSADAGNIYVLPDRAHTGTASEVRVYAHGLNGPDSLTFYNGYLYVAEYGRVIRYTYHSGDLQPGAAPEVIVPVLPTGGLHVTRTVIFGPDIDTNGNAVAGTAKMYVSAGSSCDICDESDPLRAAVLQFNPDGSGLKVLARGLRNAVGLAVNPANGQLWASVNERNTLGATNPPDYLALLKAGMNTGWPYCYADTSNTWQVDPHVGKGHESLCTGGTLTHPTVLLAGHIAPLGLTFLNPAGSLWPMTFQGGIFLAEHGTYGDLRPKKVGYNIVYQAIDHGGHPVGPVQEFAAGWLNPDNTYWGRPVAPVFGADGALYISDDVAGAVYRVTYTTS